MVISCTGTSSPRRTRLSTRRRIAGFRALHPGIDLELHASDKAVMLGGDGAEQRLADPSKLLEQTRTTYRLITRADLALGRLRDALRAESTTAAAHKASTPNSTSAEPPAQSSSRATVAPSSIASRKL